MVPDEAVICTEKDPETDEETFRFDTPDPPEDNVTLGGLKFAELLVVVRETDPLNPLKLVSVRVVVFENPA